MDDGSNKRDVIFNTYDDASYWAPSSYDRRHVLTFHYIYGFRRAAEEAQARQRRVDDHIQQHDARGCIRR